MEITEVRIKLMEEAGERLQAFCSITFDDCFVIRDLKIIEGSSGPFVAMPSRKLTAHCPQCGSKNHLRAGYCNQCGQRLKDDRAVKDEDGRTKLYADIAHPINSACREMIQQRVIKSYHEEIERSKLPGYVSTYDEFDEELVASAPSGREPGPARRAPNGAKEHMGGKEAAAARTPAAEPAKIETAEIEPRPPHKMTKPTSSPRQSESVQQSEGSKRGGFGAGIL